MEQVKVRSKRSENWLKYYQRLYLLKDNRGQYIYNTNQSLFRKQLLSSGIEGKVYKTTFINRTKYKYKQIRSQVGYFITKTIHLKRIIDTKEISETVIDAQPEDIYKLFYTKESFNKPSLTELVALTLTNQLIFQNICPHYIINYYWDYENNVIRLYNEYANYGDFIYWCQQSHSEEIWLNALFQIMVAILAIKRYFNMIHTDLHIGNILVHKVKPGGYWTYIIDNKRYYVPNLGYVFVLSDFGFAWIPNKIQIPWYFNSRLKYITKSGQNIYDVLIVFKSLLQKSTVPHNIKLLLKSAFNKREFIIFKKSYYKHKYNLVKNDRRYKKQTRLYKYILSNYDKIKVHKSKSIHNKIVGLFYKTFKTKPNNQKLIEIYSLNKTFKKNSLPDVFRQLVL